MGILGKKYFFFWKDEVKMRKIWNVEDSVMDLDYWNLKWRTGRWTPNSTLPPRGSLLRGQLCGSVSNPFKPILSVWIIGVASNEWLTKLGILNSSSIVRLQLKGDVHPLSGPTTTKCPVCAKAVSKRHYRYACEDYKQISHAKYTRQELKGATPRWNGLKNLA